MAIETFVVVVLLLGFLLFGIVCLGRPDTQCKTDYFACLSVSMPMVKGMFIVFASHGIVPVEIV